MSINTTYASLCGHLYEYGEVVGNTREMRNVMLAFNVNESNIISCRNISLPYLFGEMTWYLSGSQSVEFISKFASLWERITDDGITSNSAYGHILFSRHGFNQLDKIVELLKKDPDSRRAVININVPNEKVIETKDEPCTIMLQFLIRDGVLDCTGVMRSNDIWFGLPYDIVFFTEVQKQIARKLGIGVGFYTHFATSMHAYEKDLDKIKAIGKRYDTREVYDDDEIEINFEPLWELAPKIYIDVIDSENPKKEIMKQFEKYGIYKR